MTDYPITMPKSACDRILQAAEVLSRTADVSPFTTYSITDLVRLAVGASVQYGTTPDLLTEEQRDRVLGKWEAPINATRQLALLIALALGDVRPGDGARGLARVHADTLAALVTEGYLSPEHRLTESGRALALSLERTVTPFPRK